MNLLHNESCASAYLREGHIIINALDRTDAGVWTPTQHIFIVRENDAREIIGSSALKALKLSTIVTHPKEWKRIFTPVLKAAGVRSWKKFVDDTKHVSITRNGNKILLYPSRNMGPKDGFVPSQPEIETSIDPKKLGEDLVNAFVRSG